MMKDRLDGFHEELLQRKGELTERLERITATVRRGYEADSKERAQQLENSEVVDALGNEARAEITMISSALARMDSGDFGTCTECGLPINEARIKAYPYALECIDCARANEQRNNIP